MRTIAIINQKGGCGKTTTAINLAGILARRGCRVLLVDLDPQGHCAAGLGIPDSKIERHVGEAMLADRFDPARILWRVGRNLTLAPSTMKLAGLESRRGGLADLPDRELRLSKAIGVFAGDAESSPEGPYDVCLIDCPPSIGLLTYNALAAAGDILIPVETSFFALKGAAKQINTCRSIARRLGLRIRSRMFPTLFDPESPLAQDLLAEMRRRYARHLVPLVVRHDVRLKEAASLGRPVVDYDPFSLGARDYAALADWLIDHATIDRSAVTAEDLEPVEDLDGLDELFHRAGEPARMLSELRAELSPAPRAVLEASTAETLDADLGVDPAAGGVSGTMASSGSGPLHGPVFGASVGEGSSVVGAPGRVAGAGAGAGAGGVLSGAVDGSGSEAGEGAGGDSSASRAEELIRRAQEMQRAALASATSVVRPTITVVRDEPAVPRAAGESVRRLYGARETGTGVLFCQPLALGDEVDVVGEFNNWTPGVNRMRPNGMLGVHELRLALSPGQHRYKLIVDGRWITDPYNSETVSAEASGDGCGGSHSVVRVARTPVPA